MRRQPSFRPTLSRLEDRLVLSQFGTTGTPVAAPADYVSLGGGLVVTTGWLKLHQGYAATAARGGNPVVFLGDSITYRWGDAGHVGPGASAWQQAFAPLGAANFGINGDQTGNVLWRVDH